MSQNQCPNICRVIGDAFNSPIGSQEILERAAKTLVEEFDLKGCHFRLLTRDRKILEHVTSYGLSEKFLDKGPVDAEQSTTEALQGKVVMVTDCANDPRIQHRKEFVEEGIVSQLTIPLMSRGQVVGVMRLSMSRPREFSPDEVELFKVAAAFCTSTVIQSMFHGILEHVTSVVGSSVGLDEVLDSIVHVVAEDLRAKGCSIRLLDASGENLDLCAAYGLSSRYLETASVGPAPGVAKALEGGECVAILDAASDPLVPHRERVVQEGIASILFVPLMIRGTAIGVLSLYTYRRYQFSEDERHLMSAIGEQCALAIRNAQMYTALQHRYERLVDDFHQWFEQSYAHPIPTKGPSR